MAEEKRKVQIEAEVTADTSGADALADALQGVGQAGQQAGQQATQGLNAISNAAAPAAEKLEQAERRMQQAIERRVAAMRAGAAGTADYFEAISRSRNINTAPFDAQIAELRALEQAQKAAQKAAQDASRADAFIASLRQQAAAVGKTRSELLALQAAEMGLGDQAAKYIAQLRAVEQGQNNVGMSAKATAAAMRGVPAQITDIVTSLASGQRPLQVFMQQGGQLKDMFGGIGPAARALGGYVAGLVNPLTIGAAAVAAVAIAAHQGSEELRGFQNAATLTGNAIGLSASDFGKLRDSISGIAGTKGKAAEALTAIAESGLRAGANTRAIAEAAVLMERATGQAISKTVDQFKQLQDAPTEAAKKLNEQYNFLTASVYAHIKSLEDQGKKQQAAEVATKALADTTKERASSIVENVGFIEGAWNGVLGVLKKVTDATKEIGREQTPAQQLALVRGEIAAATGQDKNRPFRMPWEPSLEDLRLREANLQEMLRLEQRGAESAAAQAQSTREGVDALDKASKTTGQYANKQTQLNQALREYHEQLAKLRADPALAAKAKDQFGRSLLDAQVIAETERGLRDSFRQTGGESDVAGVNARRRVLELENARRAQALQTLDFSQPLNLTDSEKKVIEIEEKLKTSLDSVTRSRELKALQTAKDTVESDKNRAAQDKQIEAAKKAVETIHKQAETAGQQADAIRQQAEAQEAANATFGKSKTAIEEMVLAQLKAQAAEADAFDNFDPKYVASLNEKVKAQERYVAALQKAELHQIDQRQTEAARVSQEEAQTLQLEISLIGRSQQEREKVIAQRKVELDLAKELAEIDKSGADEGDKEVRRIKARENARVKSENAVQKTFVDDWQRTADSINNSLTDALLRGFESGKGFAHNLRDTLKNMFQTLVLRPIIQAVMAPVSGTLAGIGQGIGQQITGSAGGPLAGIGQGFSAFGMTGSQLGFLGAIAAGGSMIGSGIGQLLGYKGDQLTVASVGGALFGGIPGAILGALVKPGGGPKTESGFGIGVPTRGDPTAAKAIAEGVQATYKSIAGQLAKDLQVGVFSATDPKGDAQTQLAFEAVLNGAKISSRGDRLGGIENVGRSDAELTAAITDESNRVILHALEATGLPDKIGAYLRQLGDIDALSGGALQTAVTKLQKAMTERQQLEATYFDLTHTDLEKLAATRERERAAIDETNQALYDQVAHMQDLKTAAEAANAALDTARTALVDSYQRESDALRAVVERQTGFAQQLRDLRDSMALTAESPLSPTQRAALASSRFQSTLTSAIGGNELALQGLGGTATDFLAAARASARTPVEVAAAFAKVQAGLTSAAAASEGRATVAQQQLDAMTQQLSALGVLNSSVLSVGQALAAYLAAINRQGAAQAAIQQAQLDYTAAIAAQSQITTTTPVVTQPAPSALPEATFPTGFNWAAVEPAATGGLRSGVVMVGELGKEVVDFDSPGRVYTAEQTAGMFSPNAQLAPLLREVVRELRAARQDGRAVDVATVGTLQKIDSRFGKWDRYGIPLGEDMLAEAP